MNTVVNKKAFVFTGFLGSGKTTSMLSSIDTYFKDKKIVVIVNEFGEIGIDGKILSTVLSKDVIELREGCVCCVLYDELNKVLSDVSEIHDFEYLFIETSGLSEPFPIYSALDSMGYNVESIICLIDAKNFKNCLNEDVFKYQIGSSNIIAINKVDLLEKEEIQQVEEEIKNLKEKYNLKNFLTEEYLIPKYEIIKTSYGKLPAYIFESLDDYIYHKVDTSKFKDNHTHEDYTQEIVKYPVDTLTYQQFIKIVNNFPKNLVRAKGLIKFKDVLNTLLFNYTYGNYTFSEFPEEIKEGFLVKIYVKRMQISL